MVSLEFGGESRKMLLYQVVSYRGSVGIGRRA